MADATPEKGQSSDTKSFTMPEKFSGKSAEDIARSYVELERLHGETQGKLTDHEAYSKIGSVKDIEEALSWARNAKAAIDQGLLIPRQDARPEHRKETSSPSENAAPWDAEDWAYRSDGERAKAIAEHSQGELKKYVDGLAQQYGTQIQSLATRDGREKSILIKALKTAIRNPNVDPEELLTQAAELAGRSPEELIDMVMDARSRTPESTKAEVEKQVAARLAEEKQKWEASQLNEITAATMPKRPNALVAKATSDRSAENKKILEGLAQQGIFLNR